LFYLLSFCGFRGKHTPAISIAGFFYAFWPSLIKFMWSIKTASIERTSNALANGRLHQWSIPLIDRSPSAAFGRKAASHSGVFVPPGSSKT
jgi:hypothetical protein